MEKMPRTGYCMLVGFGRDRGFLGRDRAFWFCVATVGFVSRQDLVLVGCSWVATVFALCRDNVAIEVPLSRSRRSQQSCCDKFGLGWEFLGRERTFLVATENRQD